MLRGFRRFRATLLPMADERASKLRGHMGPGTRHWLQLPSVTVSVATGNHSLDNKRVIPEAWVVKRLPVYLNLEVHNRSKVSLCLTDMTEDELSQLQVSFNAAISAALEVCKELDEAAFEVLNNDGPLQTVPNRALRGVAPHLVRKIETELKLEDMTDEDRETISVFLKREGPVSLDSD